MTSPDKEWNSVKSSSSVPQFLCHRWAHVPIWDYEGADGQALRHKSTEVLLHGACVCVCVSDRRLRDDCLAAARSFNPALSLPPSPALNWVTGDDGPSEGNFNYHDSIGTDGEIDSSLKRCHLQAESHLQVQRWVQTGSRITVWSEDLVR